MTQGPKRLRDDPSAKAFLADDTSFEPPARAKDMVWASLGGLLGPGIPSPPTDPSAGMGGSADAGGGAASSAAQGAGGAKGAAGAAKAASAAKAAELAGAGKAAEAVGAAKGAAGATSSLGAAKGAAGAAGAAGAVKGAASVTGAVNAAGVAGAAKASTVAAAAATKALVLKVTLVGALTSGAVGVALWPESPRSTPSVVDVSSLSAPSSSIVGSRPTGPSGVATSARAKVAEEPEAEASEPSVGEEATAKHEEGVPAGAPGQEKVEARAKGGAIALGSPGEGRGAAETSPRVERSTSATVSGMGAAPKDALPPVARRAADETLRPGGAQASVAKVGEGASRDGSAPEVASAGPAEGAAKGAASAEVPVAPPVASASAAPASSSPPVLAADLREESVLVRQARARLREGDGRGALGLLEAMNQRFGAGGLGQERGLLAVEALVATGQRERAVVRAEGMLRDHPASPYADRLRRIVESSRRDANGERVRTPTEKRH